MQDNIFSRIAMALALVVSGASRGHPELEEHLKAIDDKLQNDEAHEASDNSAQSARLDVLEQGIATIANALPSDAIGSGSSDPMTGALPASGADGGGSVPPSADDTSGSDVPGADASGASDVPPATGGTGGGTVPPAAPAV